MASRVGLPERTIRYYDRIELVSPRARSEAGYRLYGPQEEGKLRFVRQAKTLGLSLNDIRALIAAAERGCCGEVVPELDRLLDQKISELDARLADLATFRDRLAAFRAGHGSGCGCDRHAAFCACLNGASTAVQPTVGEGSTADMVNNSELKLASGCGCGCGDNAGGCGCGCDGGGGCGDVSATTSREQIVELEEAKPSVDQRLTGLRG